MNELGALLLVFSGSLLIFSLLMALCSLSLRSERQLFRSLSLELLDFWRGKNPKESLNRKYFYILFGVLAPLKSRLLRILQIPSRQDAGRLASWALHGNFLCISLALLLLVWLLLSSDLSNHYVVSNSSVYLSAFFRFTALWAGSSGSLLFWYWLLALFSSIALFQTQKRKIFGREAQNILCLILICAQLLFAILNLFFADAQAFRIYPQSMQSGRGINPLLLHWAMIIHPPILYIGYVSAIVPFALLFCQVLRAQSPHASLWPLLRRWSLFSWFFLGTGILLGSKWAYEELGWGGYWAWDPVENASLMPWLICTAFLHSIIVQERRGMLRFWNAFLIALSYHMCLVGTWITRSGILEGPHTFAESTIGLPMILFIMGSALYFFRFLYFSRSSLRPQGIVENLTSKEGTLLFNNFLMLLAMLIILLGVFSPLLPLDCSWSEGWQCYKIEWKQGAYNRLLVPLGIGTLFLMGASPLLTWKRSAAKSWRRNLRWPLLTGLLGAVIFAASYGLLFRRSSGVDVGLWGTAFTSEIMAILTVGTSLFVIAGIFQEYKQGIQSRRLRFDESILQALRHLFFQNKGRYGGYLVHLAVVFLCIGYAGSAFKQSMKLEFLYSKRPWSPESSAVAYFSRDKAYVEQYEIQARELFLRPVFLSKQAKHLESSAAITISQEAHYYIHDRISSPERAQILKQNPRSYEQAQEEASMRGFWTKCKNFLRGYHLDGHIRTERHFYPQINPRSGLLARNAQMQSIRTPTSEPGMRSRLHEDLYIQLGSITSPEGDLNLNHAYESYYHFLGRSRKAYQELFPAVILASLEIWINPLVKFIWLGSGLFFLAGLLLVLPFGEKKGPS